MDGLSGHGFRLTPHVDLVLILVSDVEPQPLVKSTRGIDLYYGESDGFLRRYGFLDKHSNDAAADPLPLETSVQIELPEKDRVVRRRGLQPADIFVCRGDDADLCRLPLASEALALACHVQVQCLDDQPMPSK